MSTERRKREFIVENSYENHIYFSSDEEKKLRYTNKNNLKVSRLRLYVFDILEKRITGTENP